MLLFSEWGHISHKSDGCDPSHLKKMSHYSGAQLSEDRDAQIKMTLTSSVVQ